VAALAAWANVEFRLAQAAVGKDARLESYHNGRASAFGEAVALFAGGKAAMLVDTASALPASPPPAAVEDEEDDDETPVPLAQANGKARP
jgi:hypothetical protein